MQLSVRHPLWSSVRPALVFAGLFSLFINLMLLAPVLFTLQVFDRVLSSRSEATLWMLTGVVVIALVSMSLVDMARGRLLVALSLRIDEMLGERVFRRLIRRAGDIGKDAEPLGLRDVATLRNFLSGSQIVSLFDTPWLVIFLFVIFLFHPWLGMLALTGTLLLVLLVVYNEQRNRVALEKHQASARRGTQWMDLGLRQADVLKSMGMTGRFTAHWKDLNAETLSGLKRTSASMGGVLALTKLVRQGIQVAMMALGVYLVIHDNLSPGVMIASTILLGRAMAPVESLIGNWPGLVAARLAYRRILPVLPTLFRDEPRQALPPLQGHLRLEQVTLNGQAPDRPILRGIDLNLPAGKSLALLGPSGSGKSSLARVITGVWMPSSGLVRIDDADLRHWDPDQLGPQVGYLPQSVELFPGTVAENIGRFDTASGPAILQAAQAALATEMILRLPDGFETRVGEGGATLSGGQAQRIGLARALYGSPRIVVLDEPNANLDSAGEQALQQVLVELRQRGCTVVLITHKPSLVSGLDYVAVMRDGALDITGPAQEVLARMLNKPQNLREAAA